MCDSVYRCVKCVEENCLCLCYIFYCKQKVVLDADDELVLFSRNTFWTSLFTRHFLEVADDTLRDDMLFYVRKSRAKSKSKIQQVGFCFLVSL